MITTSSAQLLSYYIHKFVLSSFGLLFLLSLLLDELVNLGSQLCGVIVKPLFHLRCFSFSFLAELLLSLFILFPL